MHMADALLSPAVGLTLGAGSIAAIGYSCRKLGKNPDSKTIPLMGVMGAFIFAAQMINFTIPGTGSSGHLGGGTLLAIILGPYAAFLVMASILTVQALFFADGGLLALGCNIWNLGVYPCFLVYPLIYKPLAGKGISSGRISIAAILSVVIALQLGAFSVVLETLFSGKSELPFNAFVALMQPIHLVIGLAEGIATAGIINFIRRTRPEIIESGPLSRSLDAGVSLKNVIAVFALLALMAGGGLSWFASTQPDGLEWSIEKITGKRELPENTDGVSAMVRNIQERTAFLPDYRLRTLSNIKSEKTTPVWPEMDAGTSAAGVIGGTIVLAFIFFIGLVIRLLKKKSIHKIS